MPDETRTIEPALTPEEWARYRASESVVYEYVLQGPDGKLWEPTTHQEMAILNDTLPDGDPRKITRDDIQMLWEVANSQEFSSEDIDDRGRDHFDDWNKKRIEALSAKLAAFLPPE